MRSRAHTPSGAGCPDAHRARRGFTLPELMLAAALAATLLSAVAAAVGSMGETVAYLEADTTDAYDKALARITRDVRYAWWVDTPSATQLRVADGANRVTEYYRVGNSLLVRLPSGEEGSVVTGLDSVSFSMDTLRRLREAAVRGTAATIYTLPAPATVDGALKMYPGYQLGFAFVATSNAGPGTVSDLDESVVAFMPTRFDLRIARVAGSTIVRIDFYPARAPGDGRPRPGAAALGGFDVAVLGLPAATVLVADPSGDPAAATYAAPSATVPLAVPALPALLTPGTAYTAVLTVRAGSMVVVAGHVSPTGARKDVQFRTSTTGSWGALTGVVPFQVNGDRRLTATSEYAVASAVHATLDPTVGSPRTASAPNYGQALANDPWKGVVPGEAPPAP